jgi:hypothetical protein
MDAFPIAEGYLGQPYDKETGGYQELSIVAGSEFDGDPASMDWLSGNAFAEAWRQYSRGPGKNEE